MAAPSTAITRLDLSVGYTEFNLMANIARFIGLKVLPPVTVEQEGAEFLRVLLASLLTKIEETERAPRGTYARDDFEWTKDSYNVSEHGVEEIVDDAEIERYGDIMRAESIHTLRLINRILQRLEYDIAAAVFNTGTWTGSSLTTTVATPWTTAASADPIANIDAAHEKVSLGCGEDANTLVCTKKGFTALIRTARLEDQLKYDASDVLLALNNGQNQSLVSDVNSGLKEVLQVENILVGRGFTNTAGKGLTASLARQWDDTMAMLCCVHDDGLEGDLENPMPQVGRTIFSSKNDEPLPGMSDGGQESLIIEEYREENRRGGVLRARNKRQVKILHAAAGHLLQGVTE